MKTVILLFFMILTYTGLDFAQAVFSNGTGGGDWNSGSTWQGGQVPESTSDIFVAGTDSVYTEVAVTCNSLTVLSGGKFATGTDPVIVTGTLELEADAYFYNQASSPELPGTDYILDAASYVVHSGSGTIGSETNNEFGNLVIRRNAGVTAASNLIINGNLIVDMLASNVVFRGANLTVGESHTHTVFGDVYIYKGIFSCVDVGDNNMVGIWNIHGNVYVMDTDDENYLESRIGPFSSANAAGLGIFNIDGDLIIDGGRLQLGTSSSHGLGEGIINLVGDLIMSANSGIATNHDGPLSINFVGNGTQTVSLTKSFSMTTSVYDTVKAGSDVVFNLSDSTWRSTAATSLGEFVVDGSLELVGNSNISGGGAFTLNPGCTLKIGSPDGISANDLLGNVQVTGNRIYSEEANYEYKSSEVQSLGNGLPTTVNGFAVNNTNGIVLDRNLTANASVNIINGDLDLNGNTLTLGENATLTESPGNTVTGSSGMITTTRNIGTPSALNVGGLGTELTAGADLGNTTVERYHSAANGNGNHGILRRYNIIPGQNNSGLNATLRLYYDESEMNGLNESGFELFKSADGSDDSWGGMGGTVNTTDNYVELTGVADFSHWTIGDVQSSLPVEKETDYIPTDFVLHQNFPNPFNPSTTISFSIPSEGFVTLKVYDVIGREIKTLVNEKRAVGKYEIHFDASQFTSGIYFYKLKSGNYIQTKKMILLK